MDGQFRGRGGESGEPEEAARLTTTATSARGTSMGPATRARDGGSPARRRCTPSRLLNRPPFFPRPAGGPAGMTEFTRAEASAWVGGSKPGAVLVSSANQACQQNENAQQTKFQWRRIARSLRTMKSAQPNSCFTCL